MEASASYQPSYQVHPCSDTGGRQPSSADIPGNTPMEASTSSLSRHCRASGHLHEPSQAPFRQRREFQANTGSVPDAWERNEKARQSTQRIHKAQISSQFAVEVKGYLPLSSYACLNRASGRVAPTLIHSIPQSSPSLAQSQEQLGDAASQLSTQERNKDSQNNQDRIMLSIPIRTHKLKMGTYNARGLKRLGRQTELSHLLREGRFDFLGLQETKCSGNTWGILADGFLINSSDTPLADREEHRGTGLVFQKRYAPALYKIYQGSSRWCGGLFYADPVPLLIVSVYAPTAATAYEEKTRFYNDLGEILRENGGALTIILGDFNAKILENPGLPENIGLNIFQSDMPLEHHSLETLENRDLFLDFLVQHGLVALNTLAITTPDKQVTYRCPGQQHFTPPWNTTMFAQMDYVLVKKRHRNHFNTVRTCPELDYDSDHLPLLAEMVAHWKFRAPVREDRPPRHNRQTTKEAKGNYNEALANIALNWDNVRQETHKAAVTHRGTNQPQAKKPYLKPETLQLLHDRDTALQQGDFDQSSLLTRKFRRMVKRDRKDHITEQLRTFVGAQKNWKAIKQLRSKLTPRFSKRGQTRGAVPQNYPEDCARFFAREHWKLVPPIHQAPPAPLFETTPDEGPFTLEELHTAIDNLKRNKAGGPDKHVTELFHDLDRANRVRLLDLYNEIYATAQIPDHFKEAEVVQIYKPGKIQRATPVIAPSPS